MIDFLVKEDISEKDASLLLQYVFNLAKDEIVIYSLESFENLTEKLPESCKCLGIKIPMRGDVCIQLQTYRIEIPSTVFLERLQTYCQKNFLTCYVISENVYPYSYYNYYKVTPDNEMIEVSELLKDDTEDDGEIYFYDTLLKD